MISTSPAPSGRPRAIAFGTLSLSLGAIFASGCAGNYRIDDYDPAQRPAREAVKLLWARRLVKHEILTHRPQEWARAAIAPDGSKIFVGSTSGRLLALTRDGRLLWRVVCNGAISSAPLYRPESGRVYFGADDGKMYAVNAKTGQVVWSYNTQGTIEHSPAFSQGLLLFTTSENRIYALEAETGKWRWQYDRERPEGFTIRGYAGVAVADDRAFTGFADGVLVALKVTTGEVVWTRSLAGSNTRFVDVDATPRRFGKLLLTSSYSGGVYAVSAESGSVQWRFAVTAASTVEVTDEQIFVTAPRVGLIALDHGGRELWRQSIPRGVPAPALAAGPYVLVTSSEAGMYIASRTNGRLIQYFDPGYGISAQPAAARDLLVVLSNQGALYAFRFES